MEHVKPEISSLRSGPKVLGLTDVTTLLVAVKPAGQRDYGDYRTGTEPNV
jgi:hypothetical protein